jgi:hypothetical protein
MKRTVVVFASLVVFTVAVCEFAQGQELRLNDKDYLEARGLNGLLYLNTSLPENKNNYSAR